MNRASTWTVGLVWAVATMAAGWAIGDLQGAMILAVGSGVLLWLFLALWRGSTLAGALLTFGVPTLMVVSGALAFGMGHRSVGNALMVGSGAMWALLAGWVLTRCSSGEYVAGFAPDGEDGEFVTHDEWAMAGWGRGKIQERWMRHRPRKGNAKPPVRLAGKTDNASAKGQAEGLPLWLTISSRRG